MDAAVSGVWKEEYRWEKIVLQGRGVIPGIVEGEALVCADSITDGRH